jgi:glycosyltransferase involved in cell wall biosynthesis
MNICVLGLRGIPDVMGGVERHCLELFPRLKKLHAQHEFIILARKPYVRRGLNEYDGVKIVPLPSSRNKYLEAASNTFLAVLHARFVSNADLLHIHAIGPALFAPLARVLGMRLIVTHHGRDYERQKWNRFAKWFLRLGEHCAISSSSKVIAVSTSLAEDLKRRYPRQASKISYIPNGISTLTPAATGDFDLEHRFGITKGDYILAVGRLVPEKGFHELIKAFKRIENGRIKLVIVGKADHEDHYSRTLIAEASDRIVFTGFQNAAILRQLYENASIFVLPSHHEGLPIAALEAAGLGIPVLLSDIAANKDIGLPPANYFPVGNIAALHEKLISDHRIFLVGSGAIADRFDWDAVALATAEVYFR